MIGPRLGSHECGRINSITKNAIHLGGKKYSMYFHYFWSIQAWNEPNPSKSFCREMTSMSLEKKEQNKEKMIFFHQKDNRNEHYTYVVKGLLTEFTHRAIDQVLFTDTGHI